MNMFDHVFVFVIAVILPVWGFFEHVRFTRDVRSGVPGAKLAGYCVTMISQWLLVSMLVTSWIARAGDWDALGFSAPSSHWAMLVAALLAAFQLGQCVMIARRPETHAAARAAVLPLATILPAGRSELTGFLGVSVTAGICEEILFRGYLPWYIGTWTGEWTAQAIAVVVFGAAHAALGATAGTRISVALKATAAAAVFAVLYLWSGSLLPGMLLHAATDVAAGVMAYQVLGGNSTPSTAPSRSAAAT